MITPDQFETYRPHLFAIAYRMTGTVMDAEDLVQDTFVRVGQQTKTDINSLKSYLSTVTVRLCLDYLKSAKQAREEYIGPWLPEPLSTQQTPEQTAVENDLISYAVLRLMEQLSPTERAVLVLRDIYDYPYREIADILNLSEANGRQIYRRAKKKLELAPNFSTQPTLEEQSLLIGQFMQAVLSGDINQVVPLLTEDAIHYSDGGGKVTAATKPLHGPEKIAKFFFGIQRMAPENYTIEWATINHSPSLVFKQNGQAFVVLNFTFLADQICQMHAILNPDKLHHLNR